MAKCYQKSREVWEHQRRRYLSPSAEDNSKVSTLVRDVWALDNEGRTLRQKKQEKQRYRGRMHEIHEEQILLQSILDN